MRAIGKRRVRGPAIFKIPTVLFPQKKATVAKQEVQLQAIEFTFHPREIPLSKQILRAPRNR